MDLNTFIYAYFYIPVKLWNWYFSERLKRPDFKNVYFWRCEQ